MGSDAKAWVRWEEEVESNDRGRREIHYYVRDAGGGRELAVVGREKSTRHMEYAVPVRFRQTLHRVSAAAAPTDLKWRSRREVIDWLSSLVTDCIPCRSSPVDGYSDDEDAIPERPNISKGFCSDKVGHHYEDFLWIGSPWSCRKRRKHYQSFHRNGITISVQDFVYVMGEDNKRLVAYIEDLYEDSRAYNMVAVRWFHKVDEVAIVLPPDTNDREIFFSLCLQDFSVECIDGLAAVLGPQDFDKFQKDERHRCSSWEPYLCRWQIDNDDLKPLDITEVPGYWSQGLLRSMYSCIKLRLNVTSSGSCSDLDKRKSIPKCGSLDTEGVHIGANKLAGFSTGSRLENRARQTVAFTSFRKESVKQKLPQKQHMLAPGCQIEVLSQDSGIRGCWFRCVILKRHNDKIKVQYQDLQDEDTTVNLEEWILASRIAAPDKLGIRMSGRPVIRPWPLKGQCNIRVGKVVDAWWHDGWWEGIVINDECGEKFHVYFPGEKRVCVFTPENLRASQEWVDKKWNHLEDRPEIVSILSSNINLENCSNCITSNIHQPQLKYSRERQQIFPHTNLVETRQSQLVEESLSEKKEQPLPGLIHDCQLSLRWNTTRKRTKGRQSLAKEVLPCKRQRIDISYRGGNQYEDKESKNCNAFALPKSLKVVDRDNCKSGRDPLFTAPITLCSSLVMSR